MSVETSGRAPKEIGAHSQVFTYENLKTWNAHPWEQPCTRRMCSLWHFTSMCWHSRQWQLPVSAKGIDRTHATNGRCGEPSGNEGVGARRLRCSSTAVPFTRRRNVLRTSSLEYPLCLVFLRFIMPMHADQHLVTALLAGNVVEWNAGAA